MRLHHLDAGQFLPALTLTMLRPPPADLEVDHDLQHIDLADGCVAGVFDQRFDFTQQEIIAGQGG